MADKPQPLKARTPCEGEARRWFSRELHALLFDPFDLRYSARVAMRVRRARISTVAELDAESIKGLCTLEGFSKRSASWLANRIGVELNPPPDNLAETVAAHG